MINLIEKTQIRSINNIFIYLNIIKKKKKKKFLKKNTNKKYKKPFFILKKNPALNPKNTKNEKKKKKKKKGMINYLNRAIKKVAFKQKHVKEIKRKQKIKQLLL